MNEKRRKEKMKTRGECRNHKKKWKGKRDKLNDRLWEGNNQNVK